ncbi:MULTISPECIES: CoA pyrophosphatase [unclassified Flavobacterium]|uniref:NUDIX hydrolase n=1 Tax=unclassified Flavobacterium TaxID=196869 RepID=UPI00156EC1BA|nr:MULTISPECIES: CoA pyrophosphatase [unclassified Flavobacterium]MBE0391332.1 putative Nudix hydrolase NudL [Flavobacterium sp. PL002]NRT15704.1 8-oxo-dGTP pyrophosphatase MutT (NUDIX family) [Flavobacterium sp. 28A]
MDFQSFLKYVPNLVQAQLPAAAAHAIMAPVERLESLKQLEPKIAPKVAAVMMLFYPKEDLTHLVLIVRNTYKGVHSAQVAFPGGKYEDEDVVFTNTALRETHEEVGVHPDKMQIIKPFTPMYIPPSNFMVHPFLGICTEEILFIPEPSEVAAIIELPLSVFLSENIVVETNLTTSYANNIKVPAFDIDGNIVWGATAMMLSELKEVLKIVLK